MTRRKEPAEGKLKRTVKAWGRLWIQSGMLVQATLGGRDALTIVPGWDKAIRITIIYDDGKLPRNKAARPRRMPK